MKVSWPRARQIYSDNPISKNSTAEAIPLRKPTKIQPRVQHNNEKESMEVAKAVGEQRPECSNAIDKERS